jgi:hypothetical protein
MKSDHISYLFGEINIVHSQHRLQSFPLALVHEVMCFKYLKSYFNELCLCELHIFLLARQVQISQSSIIGLGKEIDNLLTGEGVNLEVNYSPDVPLCHCYLKPP